MNKTLRYILTRGKPYKPGILPAKIKRGPVGQCGDTCVINALLHDDMRYVEGLASSPSEPHKWTMHAWLTDGTYAYDPTWRCYDENNKDYTLPVTYLGFEMPIVDVAEFMLKTRYQGVIMNAWKEPKMAKKLLPKNFPITKIENGWHNI